MSEIIKIKNALSKKLISNEELFCEYLKRAKERQSAVNSYISFCEYEGGEAAELSGIPFAVKDNLSTDGVLTTAGSEMLSCYTPFYDAFAVSELKKLGAAMIGKTNMDEFAMGSTGETSFYGATKNPRDLERVPGGSSSGSAAAVADKTAIFALGTDTGGSVRIPAAYCSVMGLAPTYGLVSRYGLIAYASSLDRVGIFANSAVDTAIVLNAISGYDERDMTNSKRKFDFSVEKLTSGVKGMKIAVAQGLFEDASPEAVKGSEEAVSILEKSGAEIVRADFALTREALSAYSIISAAEASSNLLRYDGVRYGKRAEGKNFDEIVKNTRSSYFGREVKRKILFGCLVTSEGGEEYMKSALSIRCSVRHALEKILAGADLLLTPTAKKLPPYIGEKGDPVTDAFLAPASLSGHPAMSVPTGSMTGLQIIGDYFAEEKILRAAHVLEGGRL